MNTERNVRTKKIEKEFFFEIFGTMIPLTVQATQIEDIFLLSKEHSLLISKTMFIF